MKKKIKTFFTILIAFTMILGSSVKINAADDITNYDGIYDGQAHSIEIDNVTGTDILMQYKIVGENNWESEKPFFTDAGEYEIEVRITDRGALPKPTYRIKTGTVKITPKDAKVIINDAQKTYGNSDPVFTGTIEGLVDASDLTAQYYRAGTEEDAGHYADVLRATYSPNLNYNVTSTTHADFTILKKNATITVDDSEKLYGETDPVFTGTVNGLVAGETLDNLSYDRQGSEEDVGEYPDVLNATFDADPNYNASVNKADFSIKAPTLGATGYDGIYDGNSHSVVVDLTTLSSGNLEFSTDNGTSWGLQNPSFTDVGEHIVYVRVTTGNHKRIVNRTVKITPKTLIINADSAEKVYGEADPAITGSVQGLISGDSFPVHFQRTSTKSGEDAGFYQHAFEVHYPLDDNYEIEFYAGYFTIHPAVLPGLTIIDHVGIYHGTNSHSIEVVDPGIAGDHIEYSTDGGSSWGPQNPAFTDVGVYEVMARAHNDNYEPRFGTGTVTVTPKEATITVDDSEKIYGQTDSVFTGTVDGLISVDTLGNLSFERQGSEEDAGEYTDVLTATFDADPNYNITKNKAKFTIHPKAATITVDDSEKLYGENDPVFTGTVDGLVAGETLDNLSYERQGAEKDAGEYADVLTATFDDAPNYDITLNKADFTIKKLDLLIKAFEDEKAYGEADPTFTGTVEGLIAGDTLDVTWKRLGTEEDEGVYQDTIHGEYIKNPNYNITETKATFTIYPSVTVISDDTPDDTTPDDTTSGDTTTNTPGTENEVTARQVDTKKETTKGDKLPSTGMSNTFTIMNMMIGVGVLLKTLNKKEED